jgi:hypothetical protein
MIVSHLKIVDYELCRVNGKVLSKSNENHNQRVPSSYTSESEKLNQYFI